MAAPVLITGASGFVGRHLVDALSRAGCSFRAVGRENGELSEDTDWSGLLAGCGGVVHLAARTLGDEQMQARSVALTLSLARQAVAAGVSRFVFLSSAKVFGENSRPNHPFTEADAPAPTTGYGRAKLTAERELAKIDGLELTIIRAPLIYGAGSKGSLRRMMAALDRGWPLPLARIDNRRSLLGVENLADFFLMVLDRPETRGTFVLADAELSTSALLRQLAAHMGRPDRLFAVPQGLLDASLRLVGRGDLAVRLLGCLELDPALAARQFGWAPRHSLDHGLAATARGYRNELIQP